MKNVTINGKKYEKSGDTPIKLSNGTLVVHYNKLGDVMGAYMVTSFRDSKSQYAGQSTATYCSMINLDNGYIAFEERASRSTTIQRVLSHLNKGDYYGQQAVKEGQFVEVYSPGEFKIDLSFDRKGGQ
jgi:hypothetical protein